MRLLTSLLFILLSGQAAAQDFHRYYDLGGNEDLRDLVVLAPDRLVGIGITQPENGQESTSLLIMDGAGEVLRAQTLDFPARTRGMALARQTDSTFWMGVWQTPEGIIDDWVVYRVNANTGEVIGGFGWGLPTTDEQIRAMTPTPDGGVVVVGNTGDDNEAIISRLAADGTEVFRRGFSIPGNRFTIFTDVRVLPGGDILAAGGFRPSDDERSGFFLARINPAGNLVWSRRYDLGNGLRADGAGLGLELLDQGLIALVGTGVAGGVRQALMLVVNDEGGVEVVFRGDPGTSARGALTVAGESLLVVGTFSQGDPVTSSGIVVRFDLTGNDAAQTTLISNTTGRNRLMGARRRPGGGYYLFGQGRLCSGDENDDALLLSTDDKLENRVANCQENRLPTRRLEVFVDESSEGELFDRSDPRFTPAVFTEQTWSSQDQICPRLDVTFADLPDPLCYREPVDLIASVTSALPADGVTNLRVLLGGATAGAGEFLEISALPPGVVITENSGTNLLLQASSPGGITELMTALSSLRYAAGPGRPEAGPRYLDIFTRNDCGASQQYSFVFNPRFDANLLADLPEDTILCPGGELLLSVPDVSGSTITWSTGATTPTLTIINPGTYGLTVTNECGTDSATITVEERETETLQAETITLFACLGDTLPFAASPEADVSYRWADGPTGPERTFRESGSYELLRSNPCSEATTMVEVIFQDCCQLYVPSAFSPNGDGINDVFRAFPDTDNCGLVTDYQLRVFDRWGGEVYAGSELTAGWDGKAREEALGAGHFVYSISYFNGLETVRRSGGVVLLR